jgi:hypothetical protein
MSESENGGSSSIVLDDFATVTGWQPIASGEAKLKILRDDEAMRLDFDFHGSGGFVVARRELNLTLPEVYAITFKMRGEAPVNNLELKLVDQSGRNVWWHQRKHYGFPVDWVTETIRSREIEFAWGPADGGSIGKASAIEIAVTADAGGSGTIWIADLRLEDRTLHHAPEVSASSCLKGFSPVGLLDPDEGQGWKSNRRSGQWVAIDFHQQHEYGGLIIDWIPGLEARDFDVEASQNGQRWDLLQSIRDSCTVRSFIALPGGESRHLRLRLRHAVSGKAFGIEAITLQPFDFSRSTNRFFTHIAKGARRGLYPRYFVGEQSYWTPFGTSSGAPQALINEEGLIELQPGSASLEPFVIINGKLLTWADAGISVSLEDGHLPLPVVKWTLDGAELVIKACAVDGESGPSFHVRYELKNTRREVLHLELFVAVRPFQVTPPWQAFKSFGGAATIRNIKFSEEGALINETLALSVHPRATSCGAAAFHHGDITCCLATASVPTRRAVIDPTTHASGAWVWRFNLHPGTTERIEVSFPRRQGNEDCFAQAKAEWASHLGAVQIQLPPQATAFTDTFRAAAAHILLNRQGFAFQPGARRYKRSWIRDGVMMGAALLRAAFTTQMRDYLRWYAAYQADTGAVPCCVDEDGPDWLVEHDSHGQLVFGVAEYVRFTGDVVFLREMWPSLRKAIQHLDDLRAQCLTPEFAETEKLPERGLLPESASHEGYLAHPVHAYWDDFWALRAYRDAAEMALMLGVEPEPFAASAAAIEDAIRTSMRLVMERRHLQSVPGSVEWADFDPTATSNAAALLDELRVFPLEALEATYRQYLDGWRKQRIGEVDWKNYTAYEVRIVGALVRLGWREEALELAQFLIGDQRPLAWHQWPEISWRNPRSPGHLGDVPHAWIAAEYMLAFRDMLAYETRHDDALILAAGVHRDWLEGEGVNVAALPVYHGLISWTLRRESDGSVRFTFSPKWSKPPAIVILRAPWPGEIEQIEGSQESVIRFIADEIVLKPVSFELRIHCHTELA